ncbi:cation transporter [Colwellia hornerae]|uniref:Cation transporter n=1 Tax=Colwellia hornerae TaxID=89402 RepID=A0A5C6QNY2_9GAMM|nr:cation transporter [Colwellia hornerae]TWX54645.1 cation transporter [Colwellia hornerae]TWX61085.1 cation transporter [Colwellia hornerae]TWX70338.1 cation transporter [Colwellia hornerae]
MSDLDHRVGVRENNLVVRNLKLSNVTEKNISALIEEIDQMFGLDEVSFNPKDGSIHLAYDAVNLNLDGIEEVIRKHEIDIHDDWWTHTKESYYKFCDQNTKDNFTHEPWSCHKTPPNSIKRRR